MFKGGKIFGKLNIIDFAVILIMVFLIVGAVLKFGNFNSTSEEDSDKNIEYTVLINDVRKYTLDALQSGDILYDSQTGVNIGTIVDVAATAAKTHETLYNGETVLLENPYKYDIILTVNTSGDVKNDAYYANKTIELKVNGTKNIETKYLKTTAIIGDIEIK